jgi:hypothetical protein
VKERIMHRFALLGVVFLAGADPAWQTYSSPSPGKFSISFPAKPQESARKLGDVNLYIVSADPNSFSRYMIYYFDTNAKEEQLKKTDFREKMLDDGQRVLLGRLGGSPRQSKITLDGNPGREVEVSEAGKGTTKLRLYLVQSRLYILAAQSRGGKDLPSADADKFLKSFRLVK